jgi:hypothetical protein
LLVASLAVAQLCCRVVITSLPRLTSPPPTAARDKDHPEPTARCGTVAVTLMLGLVSAEEAQQLHHLKTSAAAS